MNERLKKRFVERRKRVIMRRMRENEMIEEEIRNEGEVIVEGNNVGKMEGLSLNEEVKEEGKEEKDVKKDEKKEMEEEFERSEERFDDEKNGDLEIG